MSDTTMTFKLGDREVNRLGYGAMQLAGPGLACLARLKMKRAQYRFYVTPLKLASTISTPAIFMVRTKPTN